jgi:hypothetical protein
MLEAEADRVIVEVVDPEEPVVMAVVVQEVDLVQQQVELLTQAVAEGHLDMLALKETLEQVVQVLLY